MRACRRCGFACAVIAAFNQAHAFAFSLATTLMVTIVIFQAGDGSLSVVPANEYDGDAAAIVHEVDPFAL